MMVSNDVKHSYSDLNYDTIIDSYLPPVPEVTTDQPMCPQEFIDTYEQKQRYKELCGKIFKP